MTKDKKICYANAINTPAIKKALCKTCGLSFKMDKQNGWRATQAIEETIQHGWFRGDDEVNFYHNTKDCKPKGVN